MQRLVISRFGPVDSCNIDINDFMVLTGSQTSGKSTIAKSIFYFNHLKDVLLDIVRKELEQPALFETERIDRKFIRRAEAVFRQSFGIEEILNAGELSFTYDNDSVISIVIECGEKENIGINCCNAIIDKLLQLRELEKNSKIKDLDTIRQFIDQDIFACDHDIIYIPAGRSLHTMLSAQINYLYSIMDDLQKSTIDYCTKCYIEEIFRTKEFFHQSPKQLAQQVENRTGYKTDDKIVSFAADYMQRILCGEYRNVNGAERLYYDSDKSVRMNYASSGQQEAVWITNTLFYHMLTQRRSCFIIEEPESHLFPNAQKLITEFISLVKNGKNSVVLTTHSPYVLGSINNLLYANRVSRTVDSVKLDEIIKKELWLKFDELGAYYIENGNLQDMKDPEFEDIDHGLIDRASLDINETYDKMLELKEATDEEGEICC